MIVYDLACEKGHTFEGWFEDLKAFEETGDPFDPETASRLEAHILSVGGSREAADLYTAFRGRMPGPAALLKGRGLAA